MAGMSDKLPRLSVEKFATTLRADYRFAPLNIFLLLLLMLAGLVAHLAVYGLEADRLEAIVLMAGIATSWFVLFGMLLPHMPV